MSLPPVRTLEPIIKKVLRETLGRHTCDRRSSRPKIERSLAELAADTLAFEPGFAEHDVSWDEEARESDENIQARLRRFLDDIFEHKDRTWISVTSHLGRAARLLTVVGHCVRYCGFGRDATIVVKAVRLGDTLLSTCDADQVNHMNERRHNISKQIRKLNARRLAGALVRPRRGRIGE